MVRCALMDDLARITACYTIRFERHSRHRPARLWRAISESEEVGRWMARPAQIDLRVGGDYFVDFGAPQGSNLDGVIVRFVPERLLCFVWGMSVLEWQLEPSDGGCLYRFVHHGQGPPDADTEDIPAGWHLWLDDFDAHLDGRSIGQSETVAKHERIKPAYCKLRDSVLGRT